MPVDPDAITEFHAHVYYLPETRDVAAQLRAPLEARFPVRLGRWFDQRIGPHSRGMYQVAFTPAAFATVVSWLMLSHGPLGILIHPRTGDDLAGHTTHALWLR